MSKKELKTIKNNNIEKKNWLDKTLGLVKQDKGWAKRANEIINIWSLKWQLPARPAVSIQK